AANLDVTYKGGTAPIADAGADGTIETVEGCPCEATEGLGCCVAGGGTPYCTTDDRQCAAERGMLLRCVRSESVSESVCCLQGTGSGAKASLAAYCDGGIVMCLFATDCPPGEGCATTVCNGIQIGACGSAKPPCP